MTTVEKYPLEKRKIIKKTIKSTFNMYIFFLIIPLWANIFLWSLYQIPLMIIDALFIVYPLIQWVYQREYYKKYFYDIRSDFLVIKKGVIAPNETILPYDKLQDVYIDQDIFDRIFKLYDVHVSTATMMSGIQAHIDGVNKENGEIFREMILDNIKSHHKSETS
jgi:membrane protein YdbS with pleckstrin-like domain